MTPRILVVEDHPESRELLIKQLQSLGYEIISESNGEEVLKKALSQCPDLIIMDLWLPGISGIQVTARLKRDPKTASIPVVAYTALEHKDAEKLALAAGVAEFLIKPTPPEVFKDVIERLLRRKRP